MSVHITEKDLQEAYAEIAEMQRGKTSSRFEDGLFELVTTALGNLRSRSIGRMSFAEVYDFLKRKGWADDFISPEALRAAYNREKSARERSAK
jgi:hypothetical protein